MSDAIEITVEIPETQSSPPSSDQRETAPVTATLELAAAVGSLSAQVEALTEQTAEATETAEQAQRSATLAVDLAIATPAPIPEPEPETETPAVTLVEVPPAVVADGPAKTPAGTQGWLARVLFG
jgi:hypothetical protein